MHGVLPKLEFELTGKSGIHEDWRAACDRVVVEVSMVRMREILFLGRAPDASSPSVSLSYPGLDNAGTPQWIPKVAPKFGKRSEMCSGSVEESEGD